MFSKNNRNNNDINNFNEVSCIELSNDYEGESDNVNNKNDIPELKLYRTPQVIIIIIIIIIHVINYYLISY